MNEAQWSRFTSGLLGYISDYYNRFVKTDYEITLNMSQAEIIKELTEKTTVLDLSPELQAVAKQYMKHLAK